MKGKSGFTIMELLTVIAIVSILTAIATPNVFRWVSTQQFNGAVRDIQATIQDMRLYAVKENGRATLTFTDGTNSYQTDEWKRGLGNGTDAHKISAHNLPASIEIFSDFAGGNLILDSRGMATNGTITINGPNGLSLQIFVNGTGSSRIS